LPVLKHFEIGASPYGDKLCIWISVIPYLLKFCVYPININFFNSVFELYLSFLRWDCDKVFVKFQLPKFPNNIITFPITVDFDNYSNFWSSRPQPLQLLISTDQRLSRRRHYFCNVWVKSNRDHPSPGNPWGIWLLIK
jgi:hypothetical protein